jgi:hypothetical protein
MLNSAARVGPSAVLPAISGDDQHRQEQSKADGVDDANG